MNNFDITNRIMDATFNELLKLVLRHTKSPVYQDKIMKISVPLVLNILMELGYSFNQNNEILFKITNYKIHDISIKNLNIEMVYNTIGTDFDSFLNQESKILEFFECESHDSLLEFLQHPGMVSKIAKILIYKAYIGIVIVQSLYRLKIILKYGSKNIDLSLEDKMCLGVEFSTIWDIIVNESSYILVHSTIPFNIKLCPNIYIGNDKKLHINNISLVREETS